MSAARPVIGTIGHLPNLAAYREFITAFQIRIDGPEALPHLIKVAQLDSSFTLGLYWLAIDFASYGHWKQAELRRSVDGRAARPILTGRGRAIRIGRRMGSFRLSKGSHRGTPACSNETRRPLTPTESQRMPSKSNRPREMLAALTHMFVDFWRPIQVPYIGLGRLSRTT